MMRVDWSYKPPQVVYNEEGGAVNVYYKQLMWQVSVRVVEWHRKQMNLRLLQAHLPALNPS